MRIGGKKNITNVSFFCPSLCQRVYVIQLMKRKYVPNENDTPLPAKKRRKLIPMRPIDIETIISIDIETIELEMFAIGAVVVTLNKNQDGLYVEIGEKMRWSTHRNFPSDESKDHSFWTQFRDVYDVLRSQAVPAAQMATEFHLWLKKIGTQFPHARYSSDFGSFDIGRTSAFLMKYGFDPLEFYRIGDQKKFRTDINTTSFMKAVITTMSIHSVIPHRKSALRNLAGWPLLYGMLNISSELAECKFQHTHLPDDDAARDGWIYMNARKKMIMMMRS